MTTTTVSDADARRVPPLGGFNLTFLGLELRRIGRNRRTLIFMVILPIGLYLAFGKSSAAIEGGGMQVRQYFMVSLALYGCMFACASGGSMVAVERALGWSRQLRLTPLRPAAYVATKILVALLMGLVPVVLLFAFGAVRGVTMPIHVWIESGLAVWLGSLVFAALGLFMGYLLPSENVMQFLGPVLGVLSVFGGIFFPISIFSPGLQTFAKFTPIWGVGELARAPVTGDGVPWQAVVNILGWLIAMTIGSMFAFRRDTKRV